MSFASMMHHLHGLCNFTPVGCKEVVVVVLAGDVEVVLAGVVVEVEVVSVVPTVQVDIFLKKDSATFCWGRRLRSVGW